MTLITIFPSRFVAGWPEHDDDRCAVAPIADAFARRWSTDAHFAPYASKLSRRHTVAMLHPAHAERLSTTDVAMTAAVFDVDATAHVLTDEWIAAEQPKLSALNAAHPGGFFYRTRNGYRVVFALAEQHRIATLTDANAWTARYQSWVRYLARVFGIAADASCADWTRLYRCPLVVRDGVAQDLGSFGDASSLGAWSPILTTADRVKPKAAAVLVGEVSEVPIDDPTNDYGRARIAAAIDYLDNAPLSVEGQRGRDRFFSVCLYLTRRLRLPIEVAADCVEAIYNPRLMAVGTTTWDRDEIENRLESARDTACEVGPGNIMSEDQWRHARATMAGEV